MSNYTKQWSSATPGYIIFLIDQSSSMQYEWSNGKNKDVYTAEVVNKTIFELIASNAAGERVKDRIFISLIGYCGDNEIVNLHSGNLSKFADNPIRVDKFSKSVSNDIEGSINLKIEMPIFLEPKSVGWTPMGGAFELAKKLIQGWIQNKENHPAPVIINISDGHPEGPDSNATELEIKKTIMLANEIMKFNTKDGPPLIFNVHISNYGREIAFPESEYELEGDKMAELLYKISSSVPDSYKKAAKDLKLKLKIKEKSRGFISNASPESFVAFINFGSSGGTIDRSSL